MSAPNRSEQLRARKLAKQLKIGLSDAIQRVRYQDGLTEHLENPRDAERRRDRERLARFIAELSRDDRLRLYHQYACRDQLVSGDFANLRAKEIASAARKALVEVSERLNRAVSDAPTLEEQLAAGLKRAQVIRHDVVKLDAGPVLRLAGIKMYVRWHRGYSIDIHLDEIGYEGEQEGIGFQPVNALDQFNAAGIEAFVEHAQTQVGAEIVRLCMIEDAGLVHYLEQRGWCDEHAGTPWSRQERRCTLSRPTPEAQTKWEAQLAEFAAAWPEPH
ncbi:MAG: hypothetical protein JWN04_3036 [Myxococcaceae bacterium]|nr:hypothetical protein [Myxococcaceae bacterium]